MTIGTADQRLAGLPHAATGRSNYAGGCEALPSASMELQKCYDVVVVGSGAAGLVAAIRLADLGLSVLVVEKEARFGGTSALSGGTLWVPNHGASDIGDSRALALAYLAAVCSGAYRQDRIEAFVDNGQALMRYLGEIGVDFDLTPALPDYFADAPGALAGRSVFPRELDGGSLGESLWYLRELPPVFRLLDRYALNLMQAFTLAARAPGWRRMLAKMVVRYWADWPFRRRTRRDRRLTLGNALIGRLYRAARAKNVTMVLQTELVSLTGNDGRVSGLNVRRNGQPLTIGARHGVVLAAGGFEQSQRLRDAHLRVVTKSAWSLTPPGGNVGGALEAGLAIGAASEFLDCAWWSPSMSLPSAADANIQITHQMFLDHGHPHSLCVNRLGKRFVNETCPYDRFGQAMIEDQLATGANVPCWMIFDATYRTRYGAGGLLPNAIMPDRKVPPGWWDTHVFRAATLTELAGKIGVDSAVLCETVATLNGYAVTGEDRHFGRGADGFGRAFGDPRATPNPCLGSVEKAPFYAVRVDLGDLGSKGGLKAGADARVLRPDDTPIDGLYAVGNSAGSPFGDCYPGAGATLGAGTVFAFIAANDIARRAGRAPSPAALP